MSIICPKASGVQRCLGESWSKEDWEPLLYYHYLKFDSIVLLMTLLYLETISGAI